MSSLVENNLTSAAICLLYLLNESIVLLFVFIHRMVQSLDEKLRPIYMVLEKPKANFR